MAKKVGADAAILAAINASRNGAQPADSDIDHAVACFGVDVLSASDDNLVARLSRSGTRLWPAAWERFCFSAMQFETALALSRGPCS